MAVASGFTETEAVDLGALLDATHGAVVTLVAGETRLAAHKAVLAARSPVFEAMFGTGKGKASSQKVHIRNMEGPVLRQLLAFCYTLRAPLLPPHMGPQLLAAASEYRLMDLKSEYEQQVATQISVETAVAAAVVALKYGCPSLKKVAINFINSNHRQVMTSQGWADTVLCEPEVALELTRLLAGTPAETSSPAAPDSWLTSSHQSQPHSQTPATTPATPHSWSTSSRQNQPHSQTPATTPAAPHSWSTSSAQSQPYSQTTARDTSPTPSCHTDDDVDSRLRPHSAGLSSAPAALGWKATARSQSQPLSDHNYTPAVAAPPTPRRQTTPPDDDVVSHLRSLSAEERGRRLIEAAKRGSVEDLEALLAAGAAVEARDETTNTALHWAADRGHVEAVRCLLEAGAEVDARDSMHATPLHRAAYSGHAEAAKCLLQVGAAVEAINNVQATPLHWAAELGHEAVVQLLLESSANPNARQQEKWTPLHWAARNGHGSVVQLLVTSSADVEATQHEGWSPLHLAAYYGHTEAVAALLAAGANKGFRTKQWNTALDFAIQQNHQKLIDMLT